MENSGNETIIVGKVTGVFGVKGWVKIHSHTSPLDNILTYSPWLLCFEDKCITRAVDGGQKHGKGIIAHLAGINDRDEARRLTQADIAIYRHQLQRTGNGEYYWVDLEGLEVINRQGERLGKLNHLLETGANDVMVVQSNDREILIPYIPASVVLEVDLENGRMLVDWLKDWGKEDKA